MNTKNSPTLHQYQIAVMSGRQVRKFVNYLKKLGARTYCDRAVLKRIEDADGEKLFSAIKYSSGWDCRVHNLMVNQLRQVIG